MLVGFADEWFTFFPAGALEAISADVGLTYAEAGLVMVSLSAGGVVGLAFIVAADYVSRRLLAALGALAYGSAMIAFGLADSLLVVLAAGFVWGAASDAFISGCEVALTDLAGDDLPRALARTNAWSAIGDLLSPLTLALAVLAGVGWRGALVGGGVLMLAYAAWLGSMRLPPPSPPERLENPLDGVLAVARDRRVVLVAVLIGLFALLDEPLFGFAIAYLDRVQGLGPAIATSLAAAAISGGIAGHLIAERAIAWAGSHRVLIGASLVMGLSLPAMVYAPHVVLLAVGGLAFGAAGATFYTCIQAVALRLRPGQAGAVSAVISLLGLGGMAYPALVGLAADAWGLAAGLVLYAAVPPVILVLIVWRWSRWIGPAK